MEIKIIDSPVDIREIRRLAEASYGDMVKAVVDIERRVMAVGGELHADAEAVLLEHGSKQADLWGINIYPDNVLAERLEYTSLINISPRRANRSMTVEDSVLRQRIAEIVNNLIVE